MNSYFKHLLDVSFKIINGKILLLFFCLGNYAAFSQSEQTGKVAVVELFTSEGCSSCPAADELLKEMSGIRSNEGKEFIGLSFHITYWNHLGWTDSYSNEAYTDRQKKYQATLRIPQIYTPQAILNGEEEFIGSNPVAFREALVSMEDRKSVYAINASLQQIGNVLTISYELNKEPKNELLNIAIIEKLTERKIARGENKSRTLKHFNVVRDFKTVDLKKTDSISLPVVEGLQKENMSVVLYVQQKKSMKIITACKISPL
jgi:hypothetical protein